MALDSSDVPYVAFRGTSNKATVMRYNTVSSAWEIVGAADFSTGRVPLVRLAFNSSDMPYVAYPDSDNSNKATVMRYTGGSWEIVGAAGFSNGITGDGISLAFDSNDVPYLAYVDSTNSNKITVMRYLSGAWQIVGATGFSAGAVINPSLAFDSNDVPHVAYRDDANGTKATVMRYTGGSWQTVGMAGFSDGGVARTKLAFDSSDVPYVGYMDYYGGSVSSTVMRFTAGSWQVVGQARFSDYVYADFDAGLSDNGVPYVAFRNQDNNYKITVMCYTGEGVTGWEVVGIPGISTGNGVEINIAFDSEGAPYVSYRDMATSNEAATVMRHPALPTSDTSLSLTKSVNPSSAKPGEAITYTIAFSNTGAITATHVVVTDTLSAHITDASFTSSGVALTQVPGSRYAWTAPDLEPGDGGLITITGVLSKPLAAGTIPNTVTLAVSGTVQTANANLTVANVAPVANAGVDQTVSLSETVTLNGSGTDDNGDTLTYGWAQTGGADVTLSSTTAPAPTFTAPSSAGVLTFTLTVTDTGSLTDTDEVVVTAVAGPQITLDKFVTPSSAKPGEAITYTIAFSNTGVITATNVVVTDTLAASITNLSWSSSGVALTPIAGQTYAWTAPDLAQGEGGVIIITGVLTKPLAAGTIPNIVTLAVSGTVQTDNADLTVENVAPVANAGVDQTVSLSETVTLNGSGTDDNGDTLIYGWTQTGGAAVTLSSASAQAPTFTAPSSAGVLTFTLTVTDTGSLTDTDEVVVAVTAGTPGYASLPPTGGTIQFGLDMGGVEVGSTVTSTLTISETGNAMLNITSLVLSGPNAADFSVSPTSFSIVDGGAAQTVNVTCTPAGYGLRTATLTVNHNAAGSPATYTLNCTGLIIYYFPIVFNVP